MRPSDSFVQVVPTISSKIAAPTNIQLRVSPSIIREIVADIHSAFIMTKNYVNFIELYLIPWLDQDFVNSDMGLGHNCTNNAIGNIKRTEQL